MATSEIALLSFGKSTAESEAEKLEYYYITTQAYLNAKNPNRRKVYYIGHRGTGKSALLNRLADEYAGDDNIILNITPKQFSYELFEDRKHDYPDVRSVYAAVWHYTLMVQMFKSVVEYFSRKPHLKTNKENVNNLKNYLIEKEFLEEEGVLNVFFSFLREFTTKKVAFKLHNIETDSMQNDRQLVRFLNLDEITKQVSAFKNITESHPVYLFIDELDTGWNNSKEAQNFIYGLFYAVNEIRKLRKVTVFVSLRFDMYNDLNSVLPDPEKMRDDIEKFTWSEKTLRGLIGNRILAYWPNDELKTRSFEEAISCVFEPGVLDYIIAHSLHRPREIIQFCNDALDEFRNHLHLLNTAPSRITMEMIKTVEPHFSNYRFSDLCEEYKHQYPGIHKLLSYFENSSEYYILDQFKSKVEEAMLKTVEDTGEDSWIYKYLNAPIRLVEILFDIGFIKVYSNKDERYLAYYETPLLNINNISRLKIHDVFASALKCQK